MTVIQLWVLDVNGINDITWLWGNSSSPLVTFETKLVRDQHQFYFILYKSGNNTHNHEHTHKRINILVTLEITTERTYSTAYCTAAVKLVNSWARQLCIMLHTTVLFNILCLLIYKVELGVVSVYLYNLSATLL